VLSTMAVDQLGFKAEHVGVDFTQCHTPVLGN
jgi:hypothetical protein